VPSASEWGAITLGDCTYPGTGESGFIAVHPQEPDVVYCGAVGSSPGGAGALQRYDHRTRQIRLVNVWPEKSRGVPPRDLRYRFAWTFPLVFSPHDRKTLYAGGNRVFRTRDEGASWTAISPDLSLNDAGRQGHSGGEITRDTAGAEVHATCACVTPSPHRPGEIWASTDDGLVHVTRDDGASWTDVTPPGLPELAYVGCVEIAAHDADTVYVSATRYKLADYRPWLFRSRDGGQRWQDISGDFPRDEITRVVRADPVRPGLLFVGTETGVFFSADDGAHWRRLRGGLPVVPVYDLKIKGSDLVAATHGRAFWILDDLGPLRALDPARGGVQLVPPRATVRTRLSWSAGSGYAKQGLSYGPAFGIGGGSEMVVGSDGAARRRFLDTGENPPAGALLHYLLPEGHDGVVRLTVLDERSRVVRVLASDDEGLAPARRPGTQPGLHRVVWDLRHQGPARLDLTLSDRRNRPLADESDEIAGPAVVPGRYTLVLECGPQVSKAKPPQAGAGEELSPGAATVWTPTLRLEAAFDVVKDPRVGTPQRALERQHALLQRLYAAWGRVNEGVNRLRRLKRQLRALQPRLAGAHAALAQRAQALLDALAAVEAELVDPHRESPRDVLRHRAGVNDAIADLVSVVAIADEAPTRPSREVAAEVLAQADAELGRLRALERGELAALNRALRAAGVEAVGA